MNEQQIEQMRRRYEDQEEWFRNRERYSNAYQNGTYRVAPDRKAGDRVVQFSTAWSPEAIVLVIDEIVSGIERREPPTQTEMETWDGIENSASEWIVAQGHFEYNGWDSGHRPQREPLPDWLQMMVEDED